MSTNATQTTAHVPAAEPEQARRLTLAALARALDALRSAPTQSELDALLRRVEPAPE